MLGNNSEVIFPQPKIRENFIFVPIYVGKQFSRYNLQVRLTSLSCILLWGFELFSAFNCS